MRWQAPTVLGDGKGDAWRNEECSAQCSSYGTGKDGEGRFSVIHHHTECGQPSPGKTPQPSFPFCSCKDYMTVDGCQEFQVLVGHECGQSKQFLPFVWEGHLICNLWCQQAGSQKIFELHGNAIMSTCTGCSIKAPTVNCVAQAEVCTQDAKPATSMASSKPTDAIVCASLLAMPKPYHSAKFLRREQKNFW